MGGRDDDTDGFEDDWVRAPPTFDYESAATSCQVDDWDDCICEERDRYVRADRDSRRATDDWDDVLPEASENEGDAELEERTGIIDEYFNGKAMDDLMGVMITVTLFFATLKGIVIME